MARPTDVDFRIEEYYAVSKVEIWSSADPLSLQADAARKRVFRDALGTAVKAATVGIFTHDVEVTLTWFIEEARRYQTHLVADLDNVMKPILDGVTGPDGILIDDNQIQSIKASWMTPGILGTGFLLAFESLNRDDYVTRKDLSFVEFAADRCYPLPGGLGDHSADAVSMLRRMVATYHELGLSGMSESSARAVLPIMRPFPRARLGRFTLLHEREFPEPA